MLRFRATAHIRGRRAGTQMHETMSLAVVGLAVLGSISVAVVVEWFALWGLMKMMPGPAEAAELVATMETTKGDRKLVVVTRGEPSAKLRTDARLSAARVTPISAARERVEAAAR